MNDIVKLTNDLGAEYISIGFRRGDTKARIEIRFKSGRDYGFMLAIDFIEDSSVRLLDFLERKIEKMGGKQC